MFDLVRQMIAIAQEEAALRPEKPLERCGVIVRDGDSAKLIECTNVALDPDRQFKISATEWAKLFLSEEVLEVWHTHPNEVAAPSQGDLVRLEKTGLPWHIVSWPEGGHSYTKPTGYVAPYEGRVFIHGILDCYALCRDWYERELGIELPDDDREDKWWDKPDGPNYYVDGFEKNGFERVDPEVKTANLKRGDGLLMQVASRKVNHAAVYLGEGKILHHLYGKLSEVTVYGGDWQKRTTHHLRHKSQL